MKLETLQDLYVEQLRDLYSAESQLIDALPLMIENASNPQLRDGFKMHLEETRGQRQRLEQVLGNLGKDPGGHTCQAMKGLIKEANELISESNPMFGKDAPDEVRDAGLIASAQRVEHYEIAGYGTVCTYAELLGRKEDLELLQKTLDEEKRTDEKLTMIAKQSVNVAAARA